MSELSKQSESQSAANAGELKGWLTGLEPATPRITI